MTFDAERFLGLVAERGLGLGRPLHASAVTGSTNDDALVAARAGEPHGALFVAENQTSGRGRRGNAWFSAAGQSLTFTLLVRPRLPLERASGLALVAGLAVRATVARWLEQAGCAQPVLVKWPNDVLVAERKLCGILAESQVRGTQLLAVVLGVGLNVGQTGLPAELADRVTSLAALGLPASSPALLLADILSELEPRLETFEHGGERTAVELSLYDALAGLRVTVGAVEGFAAGINRSGSLLVKDDRGELHAVVAGHVETLKTRPCGSRLDEA